MIQFYEWNYDTGKQILWERHGECNQCGQCCTQKIKFFVSGNMDGSNNTNVMIGGEGVEETGQWSEVTYEGQRRFFGNLHVVPDSDYPGCSQYHHEQGCMQQGDKPFLCQMFPMSPRQIATFDECSYTFEKIGEWDISEGSKT